MSKLTELRNKVLYLKNGVLMHFMSSYLKFFFKALAKLRGKTK